ncbi:MAG: NYN domain-containing protein, partial [Candidatus Heimdallarchaeota archaeon]
LENCPPAKGTDSVAIISLIREKLMEHGPIKQISGYADLSRIPEYLKSSLQSSGVHLIDVPSTHKDAADKMIISDLVIFAVDNPAPQTLILISGDQDFAYPIAKLRLRGYRIIVIVPPGGAAEGLKRQADQVFEWTEFSTPYSSDEIASEEARESLAFEPLLIAINYLQDQGHEKPSLAQLGKIIHHLSPQWKQIGVNTLTEYVDKAKEEGLVITGGPPAHPWVALERQTPYNNLNFEDVNDKFEPLIDILDQAEDENILEPELAWVGSQLRFIFPDWRYKTGYNKLIDYITGAVENRVISIRHDGLQNYISKLENYDKNKKSIISKTLNSDIKLLFSAWESLRKDELLPT